MTEPIKASSIQVTDLRKVIPLTKAQLAQTDLPGSRLVKPESLQYGSAESKAIRAVLASIVGAGVGLGVGQYRKKKHPRGKLWHGVAVGGTVGALGSLLFPTGKGDVEVIGASMHVASVKDKTKPIGIVFLGSKATASKIEGGQRLEALGAIPIFVSNPKTQYPGWAGAVLQHGVLCQKMQMQYVWYRSKGTKPMEVAPNWGYWTKGWGVNTFSAGSRAVAASADVDRGSGSLYTNRYAEWPCPVWPEFGLGSDISVGGIQGRLRDRLEYLLYHNPTLEPGGNRVAWVADQQGFGGKHGGWNRYFAHLSQWKNNAKPHIDGYWTKNDDRRKRFDERYNIMIRRAQWFVWAAEMLRIHTWHGNNVGVRRSEDWMNHCHKWGIGCASDIRISKRNTMGTLVHDAWLRGDTKEEDVSRLVNVQLDGVVVEKYLELVMDATPSVIGAHPDDQLTIASSGPRMLLDFPGASGDPVGVGAILPDMDSVNTDFFNALIARQLTYATAKGPRIMCYLLMAVIELVATYFTTGAATVLVSAFMTLCTTIARMGMTNGGKFATGDIAQAVGSFLAAVLNVTGVTDILGDTFEGVLKNIGDLVSNEDDLMNQLNGIIAVYESLKNDALWDYADEVFGTMVNMEDLFGVDVDAALADV